MGKFFTKEMAINGAVTVVAVLGALVIYDKFIKRMVVKTASLPPVPAVRKPTVEEEDDD